MGLQPGNEITYRLMPHSELYTATVVSIDEQAMELRLTAASPTIINRGHYVLITEPDTDIEHYSEVAAWDGRTLRLKRMWTGQRGFFRVDDAFPVIYRSVDGNDRRLESRIFSGFGTAPDELEGPDESISPRVWKMLADINTKLGMILERLNIESEGLAHAENIPVNISASGIRFSLDQGAEVGKIFELKMLLPVYPPVGILVHGVVVRAAQPDKGEHEVSLRFVDLVDEVRDVIIQYTLKRQREFIRQQREQCK